MNNLLLLLVLTLFCVNEAMASQYKIVHSKGPVSILRNQKKIPVSQKLDLELKDIIITGKDSLAVVKSDRMTLKIVANSEVSISELDKEIVVDISSGGIVANYIKQKIKDTVGTKLRVNTKHTSMGVRGTTFFAYNNKDQTSYLTVKEGEVEFRGKNSSGSEFVSGNKTAFTDSSLKNRKPSTVGFESEINWELSNMKSNLSQPKKLFSKMQEQWDDFKKENEKKWKKRNDSMDDQWNKMKDQL